MVDEIPAPVGHDAAGVHSARFSTKYTHLKMSQKLLFEVRETVRPELKKRGVVERFCKINHAIARLKSFPHGGAIKDMQSEMFMMTRTIVEKCGECTCIYELFTKSNPRVIWDTGKWIEIGAKPYNKGA